MLTASIPPPLIHYIQGIANKLADVASRDFKIRRPDGSIGHLTDFEFLTKFNKQFPLQNASWRIFHLNHKVVSRVIATLLMKPCSMASWRQPTTKGNAFGVIGSPTATNLTWTPASPQPPQKCDYPPWQRSPSELDKASIPPELVSECKQYKLRYEQWARPSNWMEKPTPATNPDLKPTSSPSNDSSKDTDEKTHQPNRN